ncbi:MAG: CPBP family intramembrane metalloprotease [Spirochaetia bacterium]|nr:CPBP family intramembrane metalloprotease [Spirochaetia bacterium]
MSNFNGKLLSCKELALTLSLFYLPGIIMPPRLAGTEFNRPDFLAFILVTGLAEAGLVFYLVTHIGGRSLADYGIKKPRGRDILFGLLSWILVFPLLFLAALALYFAIQHLPEEAFSSALPPFRWSYTNYLLLPVLFLVCMVTGYNEELFYRAYLPVEFFRLGMPFPFAVFLPVLLFGSGHFYQGTAGFAAACLLGVYFTGVFRIAKNVNVPALAHGLYNFCVLLVSGIDFSRYLVEYPQFFSPP